MAFKDSFRRLAASVAAPRNEGLHEDYALAAHNELKGFPGEVQRFLDDTAAEAGKKIWRGMVYSIGSGIGKGLAIASLVVVGLSSMATAAGIEGGIAALFTGGGAAVLLGGAVLGAIMEIHQNQKKISAEIAKVEAASFEAMRKQAKPAPAREMNSKVVEPNFAARERSRRETQQHMMSK